MKAQVRITAIHAFPLTLSTTTLSSATCIDRGAVAGLRTGWWLQEKIVRKQKMKSLTKVFTSPETAQLFGSLPKEQSEFLTKVTEPLAFEGHAPPTENVTSSTTTKSPALSPGFVTRRRSPSTQ